jgi:hypothetical protein
MAEGSKRGFFSMYPHHDTSVPPAIPPIFPGYSRTSANIKERRKTKKPSKSMTYWALIVLQ